MLKVTNEHGYFRSLYTPKMKKHYFVDHCYALKGQITAETAPTPNQKNEVVFIF